MHLLKKIPAWFAWCLHFLHQCNIKLLLLPWYSLWSRDSNNLNWYLDSRFQEKLPLAVKSSYYTTLPYCYCTECRGTITIQCIGFIIFSPTKKTSCDFNCTKEAYSAVAAEVGGRKKLAVSACWCWWYILKPANGRGNVKSGLYQ